MNSYNWEGEERREAKRRYTIDRRLLERRKKYWSTLLLPVLAGIIVTGILSWGAYVTHITYGISAKYEESFVKHIKDQLKKDALMDHKLELIQAEHNRQMIRLRDDMNTGFKEIRVFQRDIYSILVKQQIQEEVKHEVKEQVRKKVNESEQGKVDSQ